MSRFTQYGFLGSFLVLLPFLIVMMGAEKNQDDDGKKLYESKCAMCHGKDGRADTKAGKMVKAADLIDDEWKHGKSQAEVEKIIREGGNKMPKYEKKLTDAQIAAIARYLRELVGVDEE